MVRESKPSAVRVDAPSAAETSPGSGGDASWVLLAEHDRLVRELYDVGLLACGWSVLPFEIEQAGRRLAGRVARVSGRPVVVGRAPGWGDVTADDVRQVDREQATLGRLLVVREKLDLPNVSPGAAAA
jgi:hypothetical protein